MMARSCPVLYKVADPWMGTTVSLIVFYKAHICITKLSENYMKQQLSRVDVENKTNQIEAT